jgi:muramoyltetrapeptide carboxypeptidase
MDPGILSRDGYLAGGDERRSDELNRYLRDPDVRAIFCARGGYGLMRILPALDAASLRSDPKLLVGFSDVTALHCWALASAGVRPVHGPVVAQLDEIGGHDRDWLFRLLERPEPPGVLPGEPLLASGHAGQGAIEGPLLGGNLSLLAHLAGTPYQLSWAGAVLFLEDVGERPYAVDRYLTRLALAGVTTGVAAALLGDFCRCEPTAAGGGPGVWEVLDERLRALSIAALRGLPAGHGERNLALPLGGRCAIDFAGGTVHLLEAAVA